jgi:cyclic beta-1,2-glucan synthetase
LWAVAITLRIILIQNLRRLADQMVAGRGERADADGLADRLLKSGGKHSAPDADVGARLSAPLSEVFAAQLAKRLRDKDPRTTPALGLLAERFRLQESSIEYVVQNAQAQAGRV